MSAEKAQPCHPSTTRSRMVTAKPLRPRVFGESRVYPWARSTTLGISTSEEIATPETSGFLRCLKDPPHLSATVAQLMASCAGTWTVSRTPATIDLGLVQCPCGRKSQMAKKARPVTSFAILQRWTDSVNQTRLTRST